MDLRVQKDLQGPMRDGVHLATDVYRPAGDGPHPTIVSRLPYDKELPVVNFSFDTMRAARSGYAVVVQDTRGRYGSEGTFTPFAHEAADGADTIAWAAAQPWSTGEVGMVGGSYFGATQWLAATAAPPALRAIAPFVTTDQYYDGWAYQGGAFQLGFNLHWCLVSLGLGELMRQVGAGTAPPARLAELVEAIDDNDALYRRLPLTDVPELDGLADYYRDWLAHPTYDEFWKATAPREAWDRITVPAMNIGGWYDLFLKGTIANYLGMKERGGSEQARSLQRLVIGPWAHGSTSGWYPGRGFGLMSGTDAHDVTGLQLRWFDHLLRGEDRGVEDDKPVQIFVMGADEWRDEDDWPLPGTEYVDWYLSSDGRANTALPRRTVREPRRRLPLRPARPRPHRRRPDVPARAVHRGQRGAARPARGRGPRRRPALHLRPAGRAADGDRPRRAGAARVVLGPRHRLHREARGRRARRDGAQPRRRHPARPSPRLPLRAVAAGAGPGLRAPDRPGRDGERVRRGPPHPPRRLQQQLPPFRPQHQHRRHHRRGADRRSGAGGEPGAPHAGAPVAAGPAGHPVLTSSRPRWRPDAAHGHDDTIAENRGRLPARRITSSLRVGDDNGDKGVAVRRRGGEHGCPTTVC